PRAANEPPRVRSAGSHRGLSSRRSLAYSSCWVRCLLNDSTSCKALPSLIGTEGGDSSGNSTCLKTPHNCSKEGRLKPFFANNVDIPFARARRLKRCPRKASACSRSEEHT